MLIPIGIIKRYFDSVCSDCASLATREREVERVILRIVRG